MTAAQSALDTVSHNIANTNTEGYSRQRVVQVASPPLPVPGVLMGTGAGQVGTGVTVDAFIRIRDQFLEQIYRRENGVGGRIEVLRDGLERVESIFNEPGQNGFANVLEQFWNAWEVLSLEPEGQSARANLREVSQTLINTIRDMDGRFDEEFRRVNDLVKTKVTEINNLTSQIADLNAEIASIEGTGNKNANDLRDRRDLIISKLSRLININVHEDPQGFYTVSVAGHPLVQDRFSTKLRLESEATLIGEKVNVKLDSGFDLDLRQGELAGLIQFRDEALSAVRHDFNVAVSAVVNRVNELHRQGFGLDGIAGRDYFVDVVTSRLDGLTAIPSATGLDTTLFELGVTSGDFFIGKARIQITEDEVRSGSTTTLRDILNRISNATDARVRGGLENVLGTDIVRLSLHNPPDVNDPNSELGFYNAISAKAGTSNFLSSLGLVPTSEVVVPQDPTFINIAKTIRLNPLIERNLNVIGAAQGTDDGLFSGPGDNRIALAMADLKNQAEFAEGDSIFGYYRSVVTGLGVRVQEATRISSNQELIIEQVDNRREAVAGVDLNQEAVDMIRFQRALEAAARMISSLDQVLDRIINGMGIVGR